MEDKIYRPRLSIDLTEEQQMELNRLITWGVKGKLFSVIVDDVIRCVKEYGQIFIAAVLTKAIKLEDYTSLDIKGKDGNNR